MAEKTAAEAIGWAILELMGHRRLAGYVTEQDIAGQGFLRLDVFEGDGDQPAVTQFYSPSAVYCITPTTQEIARAATRAPAPVSRWELAAPEREDEPDDAELADNPF